MNKITGYLIDAVNGTAAPVTIGKNLSSYYQVLHCDTIDIVSRKIGGRPYLIICDDEGLLKDKPKITAIDKKANFMLVGSLLIVNDAPDGEIASLTDKDIDHIKSFVRLQQTFSDPPFHPILHKVEYC